MKCGATFEQKSKTPPPVILGIEFIEEKLGSNPFGISNTGTCRNCKPKVDKGKPKKKKTKG